MNSNKTISILGAGWLGYELAKELLLLGYNVKGSTTSPEKLDYLKSNGIEPFLLDLSKEISPSTFFETDILILNIPPGRRDPDVATNYPARIKKAILLAKEGSIKNMVLISSTGVYTSGFSKSPEWDFPTYIGEPANAEGKSAVALITAEQLLRQYYSDNGTIIRFGGLVGGDRLAGRFLAGKKDITNSRAPVNMIHRDDCVGIIKTIIKKNMWGKSYNATADEHPSRSSFYIAQAEKYGFEVPTFLEEDQADGKIVSNRRLKEDLNYNFIHPDPMLF